MDLAAIKVAAEKLLSRYFFAGLDGKTTPVATATAIPQGSSFP
jgi:hypothetical protein